MFTLNRTAKCQVSVKDKGKYLAECGERQNGQGDLTITVGSRSTKVHRSILMDSSDYFRTMFTGGFSEADATTLDLSHIFEDLDELNAVLDYLYSGSISLSEENITSVTNSACFLLLADLQDACSDFLIANLSPSTSINIFVLSERHNMNKLQGACLEVIKAWFPFGLCHSPEALYLSPSCLCVLVKAGVLAMLSNDMKRTYLQKWHKHFTETSSGSTVLPREIEELIQPKLEEKDQLEEETRELPKSSNEGETEAVLYALLTSGSAKTGHCATEVHAFAPKKTMGKSILTHKFSQVVKPVAVPTLIGLNDEMAFFMFTKQDLNNSEECIIIVDLTSNGESVIQSNNDFSIKRSGDTYVDSIPYYFLWGGQLHAIAVSMIGSDFPFKAWCLYRNKHKTKCLETCQGNCWIKIFDFSDVRTYAEFLAIPFQGALYVWVKEYNCLTNRPTGIEYAFKKVSEPGEEGEIEVLDLAPERAEEDSDVEGDEDEEHVTPHYYLNEEYSSLCNVVSDSEAGSLTFTHRVDNYPDDPGQDCEWHIQDEYAVLAYNVTEDKWGDENSSNIRYPTMLCTLINPTPVDYKTKVMRPCLLKSKVTDVGFETCIGAEYFSRTISPYNSPVWKLNTGEVKWDLVTYLPHSLSKFQYFQFGELSSGHLKSLPDSQFGDFSTKIGQSAVVHSAETCNELVFTEKVLSSEEYAEEWAKLWQDTLK